MRIPARLGGRRLGLVGRSTLAFLLGSGVGGGGRTDAGLEGPIVRNTDAARLVQRLHAGIEEAASTLRVHSRLLDALARLAPVLADLEAPEVGFRWEHRAVKRPRAYLEAHFAENVSLQALAEEAGLSPFHLARMLSPPRPDALGLLSCNT